MAEENMEEENSNDEVTKAWLAQVMEEEKSYELTKPWLALYNAKLSVDQVYSRSCVSGDSCPRLISCVVIPFVPFLALRNMTYSRKYLENMRIRKETEIYLNLSYSG